MLYDSMAASLWHGKPNYDYFNLVSQNKQANMWVAGLWFTGVYLILLQHIDTIVLEAAQQSSF